jgi:hypothetical protein
VNAQIKAMPQSKQSKVKKQMRRGGTDRPRVPRGIVSPFPSKRTATFRYVGSNVFVEPVAGGGTQWILALNSLFDPDVTFAGHQPLYYDQLLSATGPYRRYAVTSVVVRLTVTNLTANSVLCAFYEQPGPIDLPSFQAVLEKPRVQRFVLSPNTGGQCTKTLSQKISIAAVAGVPPRRLLDDDVFSGLYNANPSQIVYASFMGYSMPPSTSVANLSVLIEVEQTATLYDLVAIGSS